MNNRFAPRITGLCDDMDSLEPTLAERANDLLLSILFWLGLYALGLTATVYAPLGLFKALALFATLGVVCRIAINGLRLYRINKIMQQLNKRPNS